jgi:hypothetical protein
MAFVHGKGVEVLYGGKKLTSFFNDATVSRNIDSAETTAFGDSAKKYITGMMDGTMSLSGMFDGEANAIDDHLKTTIGAAAADVATVLPEGAANGKAAYSAAVRQTSYEVSSPIGDVVAVSLEVQADGGVDRCVILNGEQAVTSSGTGTPVDNTAASSNGAAAYLHVTANTRDGATTFKVQSSADNNTWADLATFTSVSATSTTAERVLVSGSVPRYLRASHAPGGSSGSITYTITLGRR